MKTLTKINYKKLVKYLVLIVFVFSLHIIEETPNLLLFYNIKPLLLLPACICIAIYEGEYVGGLFGFFAGILSDSTGTEVFGLSPLLFMIICVTAGLLSANLLKRNYLNIAILSQTGVFLYIFTQYYFEYSLYGYEGLEAFFYVDIMPRVVYSGIYVLIFCAIAKKYHYFFEPGEMRE